MCDVTKLNTDQILQTTGWSKN